MSWNQDFASTPSCTGKLVEELNNDPTVAGGPAIEQLLHEPSTDLTQIVWASEPTQGVKDAAAAVVAVHSATKAPQYELVEATGDTTTVSATDELVAGMALTPVAGTYLVTFSGAVDHDSNNESAFVSIYAGGAMDAVSEKTFKRGGGQGNVTASITCKAEVTVDGMEAIEAQWRTPSGTATMHKRQLLVEKVG